MKTVKWINSNKMLFESPHKTFNRQCRLISTGNQIGDVVLSTYIRSKEETECNGSRFPKGHLQDYDLGWLFDAPCYVRDYVKEIDNGKSVILYQFRHFNGTKKIIDGYVLTDKDYGLLKVWYESLDWRAREAVEEAIKYITK